MAIILAPIVGFSAAVGMFIIAFAIDELTKWVGERIK